MRARYHHFKAPGELFCPSAPSLAGSLHSLRPFCAMAAAAHTALRCCVQMVQQMQMGLQVSSPSRRCWVSARRRKPLRQAQASHRQLKGYMRQQRWMWSWLKQRQRPATSRQAQSKMAMGQRLRGMAVHPVVMVQRAVIGVGP